MHDIVEEGGDQGETLEAYEIAITTNVRFKSNNWKVHDDDL